MNLITITGNTFPVKDQIKALSRSVRWNGAARGWDVPAEFADAARALVAGATPAAVAPAVDHVNSVQWSDEQQAIFAWFRSGSGNLVVQARAGTGKTTTIKQAFSFAPETGNLLYAVFNKKNQREAMEKITDARVTVKTLHGLGFMFIKNMWPDAKPDDNVESARLASVCGQLPEEVETQLLRLVGFCKNLCDRVPEVNTVLEIMDARSIVIPDEHAAVWSDAKVAQTVIGVMNATLERDSRDRISFNDMVWLPVAAGWVNPAFELVVVDEAQDMNLPQLMMAERASSGRICVVGDDRQAIYGFRGAASDGMHLMKQRLNAAQLGLTITYRCPKAVVAEAQKIVADYSAAPSAPEGEFLSMPLDKAIEGLTVGDAVLSRMNAPLMGIALSLLRRGIPARIEGRDIGKQLVALVRKFRAKSVPDFLKKVSSWSDKQIARAEASGGKYVANKIELIQDQALTLIAVAEGCNNVDEIVARILNLFEDSDSSRRPAVVCSSVHKAKGLEWGKVVLIAGTFKNRETEGEEANIYYVAVTRAKKTLIKGEK
jgi:hypothetical protein